MDSPLPHDHRAPPRDNRLVTIVIPVSAEEESQILAAAQAAGAASLDDYAHDCLFPESPRKDGEASLAGGIRVLGAAVSTVATRLRAMGPSPYSQEQLDWLREQTTALLALTDHLYVRYARATIAPRPRDH